MRCQLSYKSIFALLLNFPASFTVHPVVVTHKQKRTKQRKTNSHDILIKTQKKFDRQKKKCDNETLFPPGALRSRLFRAQGRFNMTTITVISEIIDCTIFEVCVYGERDICPVCVQTIVSVVCMSCKSKQQGPCTGLFHHYIHQRTQGQVGFLVFYPKKIKQIFFWGCWRLLFQVLTFRV